MTSLKVLFLRTLAVGELVEAGSDRKPPVRVESVEIIVQQRGDRERAAIRPDFSGVDLCEQLSVGLRCFSRCPEATAGDLRTAARCRISAESGLQVLCPLVRSLYTPSGVAGTGASSAPWLQEPTWPLLVLTWFSQGLSGVPTPERTSL